MRGPARKFRHDVMKALARLKTGWAWFCRSQKGWRIITPQPFRRYSSSLDRPYCYLPLAKFAFGEACCREHCLSRSAHATETTCHTSETGSIGGAQDRKNSVCALLGSNGQNRNSPVPTPSCQVAWRSVALLRVEEAVAHCRLSNTMLRNMYERYFFSLNSWHTYQCCGAKGRPSTPLSRRYLNRHNQAHR